MEGCFQGPLSLCRTGIYFYSPFLFLIGVHDFRFAPILLNEKSKQKNQEKMITPLDPPKGGRFHMHRPAHGPPFFRANALRCSSRLGEGIY